MLIAQLPPHVCAELPEHVIVQPVLEVAPLVIELAHQHSEPARVNI
jgi:hypothetical protein